MGQDSYLLVNLEGVKKKFAMLVRMGKERRTPSGCRGKIPSWEEQSRAIFNSKCIARGPEGDSMVVHGGPRVARSC